MSASDWITLGVAVWLVLVFLFLIAWVAMHGGPRDTFDSDHPERERVGLSEYEHYLAEAERKRARAEARHRVRLP